MTSSTITLPTDVFSTHFDTEGTSLSKPRASHNIEPPVSPAPTLQRRHDHEAVEMTSFRDEVAMTSTPISQAPEVPAWTMSLQKEWIAIAACCGCAALQNAQSNSFIAQLPNNASAKMGLLHASYGTGAFIAPLIATQFSQLPRWSFHYLTSLGVAILNSSLLLFVFKLRRLDEVTGAPEINAGVSQGEGSKYKDIFASRAVQLIALFIWVYVGTEVTIGGEWSNSVPVTGTPIELRRPLHKQAGSLHLLLKFAVAAPLLGTSPAVSLEIGERRVIYIYCFLAIGLELIVWLVPDIIGNALAVSFVGLLLGPMYPIAMNITSNIVPRRILTGSIGWIASFGQAGSAVFPFITGVLAQKYGVKVLQP
ncbi:hypothetical protein FRC11_011486, partial [Ceratobasidium sp. 423]